MSKVDSKIDEMKLKKVFFRGFDKESVYLFIRELYSLYQEEVSALEQENEELLEKSTELNEELDQANKDIVQMQFQLEAEQKFRIAYNERLETLKEAIDLVNDGKEWIIEDTKRTAATILDQANEQLERIKQECSFQQRRREAILSKITGATRKFDSSMEKLRSNLFTILGEVDTLRKETSGQNTDADNANETENNGLQSTLNESGNQILSL